VKSPYSILDAINNLHRLDASYWKALVSNGIPGLEIIPSPSSLASRVQPKQEQLRHVIGFLRCLSVGGRRFPLRENRAFRQRVIAPKRRLPAKG